MKSKRCLSCGQPFQPRSQNPHQSHCSVPDCQHKRRRQWLRLKLQTDPDYQDNQARAQRAWSQRNPDCWVEYRKSRPEYVAGNRALQRPRNANAKVARIAKMDASIQKSLFFQAFIVTVWCPMPKLQRWTRGSWKSRRTTINHGIKGATWCWLKFPVAVKAHIPAVSAPSHPRASPKIPTRGSQFPRQRRVIAQAQALKAIEVLSPVSKFLATSTGEPSRPIVELGNVGHAGRTVEPDPLASVLPP